MQSRGSFIHPALLVFVLFCLSGFALADSLLAVADPARLTIFSKEETTFLQRLSVYWIVAVFAHFAELSSHPEETRGTLWRRISRCLFAATVGVLLVGWARDAGKITKLGEELGALAVTIVAFEVIVRGIRAWVEKKGV